MNTGNLFLYGQGVFSKKKRGLEERKLGVGGVVGLTVAACATAVAAMVLAAPFTFGLSLLGIPPEIAACAAAGILVSAVGFATVASNPGQTNPVIHPQSIYAPFQSLPTTTWV